ncbi:MAG: phytase [Spirochaetales bacterium]|nr:phytase [Spirochaetales bacterium]
MKKRSLCLFMVVAIVILAASCASKPAPQVTAPIVRKATKKAEVVEYIETRTDNLVQPIFETGKTGLLGGDADDPAYWIHPTDPSRSLIFGVDKMDGLWVWDFTGKELTHIDPYGKPGNVDVRTGLKLGDRTVDIVALNLRKIKYEVASKIAVYEINPDWTSGEDVLITLTDGERDHNDLQSGTYGFGLYKNPETGSIYAFENASTGPISQYLIEDDGTGEGVKLTHVRDLEYDGSTCEGMVADDELGFFYVGEEDTAIHKYYADPSMPSEKIHSFGFIEDGYSRDREGVALYACSDGAGYILVVDQGDASNDIASIYRIYDRAGDNPLVKTVALRDRDGNPMWDDDGIDACATPVLPLFPNGFVIAHDGANSTYPVYDWRDIAGDDLGFCGE